MALMIPNISDNNTLEHDTFINKLQKWEVVKLLIAHENFYATEMSVHLVVSRLCC